MACALATVSYSGHFRVLLQFYLSYAANVVDPSACKLLALVSTEAEAASLTKLLFAGDHVAQLQPVLDQLTIVDLPTVLPKLSPGTVTPLPSAKNKGTYGRLYVCVKKAFAARYAHEILGAEHAIVTDSEAYVWKPLSVRALFQKAHDQPTVWYADAPVHHRAHVGADQRGAGAARASRAGGSAIANTGRGLSDTSSSAPRGSPPDGRDMVELRRRVAMLERELSSAKRLLAGATSTSTGGGGGNEGDETSGGAERAGMIHPGGARGGHSGGGHHHGGAGYAMHALAHNRTRPAAAVRHLATRPAELAKVDANWCSLHMFGDARGMTRQAFLTRVPSPTSSLFEYMLFSYPRDAFRAYWRSVEQAWGGQPFFDAVVRAHEAEPRCVAVGFWMEVSWHLFLYGHYRPPFRFLNATAHIERSFGHHFVRQSVYVNARLELLWRAVSNGTMGGFRDFYARNELPFFRFEHRARGSCLALRLVADIPPPAATLQANSAVPNWVFEKCTAELNRMREWRRAAVGSIAEGSLPRAPGAGLGAPLPWVKHDTKTRRD